MSEKIYTEPIKYNVGDRGNYFKKKYNLFNYCAFFTLIVFLGSAFFTGSLDNNNYVRTHSTYTYPDYKNLPQTIVVYDYDWVAKFDSLSNLKNVFEAPSYINNGIKSSDNLHFFQQYVAQGYLTYHKFSLGDYTNYYWSCNAFGGSSEFYSVEVERWWNSIGKYISQYFWISDSQLDNQQLALLHINDNYYDIDDNPFDNVVDNTLYTLNNFIETLYMPFKWISNALYDFGVVFDFIVNW